MAGDWIKMRTALGDDPDVMAICAHTGLDVFAVVGRLHRIWGWFSEHTKDGHARSVTKSVTDHICGHAGFSDALEFVGWLSVTSDGLRCNNFNRHLSQAGKARALANKRKAAERSRKRHAASVTKTRPEKRREEKNIEPSKDGSIAAEAAKKTGAQILTADDLTYPAAIDTPEVRQAMARWLDYKAGRGPRERYRDGGVSLNRKLADAEKFGAAAIVEAIDHAIASTYQGFFPRGSNDGNANKTGSYDQRVAKDSRRGTW